MIIKTFFVVFFQMLEKLKVALLFLLLCPCASMQHYHTLEVKTSPMKTYYDQWPYELLMYIMQAVIQRGQNKVSTVNFLTYQKC